MKPPVNSPLWVILASATLTTATGIVIAPSLNLMREGLGVDPAAAGFIITAHGLCVVLFSPVFGALMDRIGTKKPFAFGLLLYGAAGSSGLILQSYWLLIVSRLLVGIGVAAFYNAITVTILSVYRAERNKVMGWRGSANSLGGIVWPLLGGFLGSFSWHLPFGVYLVGIPLGVLVLLTMPDVKQYTKNKGSLATVFKENPLLFGIYGLMFLQVVLLYGVVVFLPQLLGTLTISHPFFISLFITAMGSSTGVVSFLYGRIKKRLSYTVIICSALGLWVIGFSAISLVNVWIIAGSVVILGAGAGLILPTVMVWVGDIGPSSFRGRISSYLGVSLFLGQFISPVIFAPVVSFSGFLGVFQVSAGVCVVSLGFILMSILVAMRKRNSDS